MSFFVRKRQFDFVTYDGPLRWTLCIERVIPLCIVFSLKSIPDFYDLQQP
jgi:hypothetical protein